MNLLLVKSNSDENERVLGFAALDSYQAEPVISMDMEWWLKHEGT